MLQRNVNVADYENSKILFRLNYFIKWNAIKYKSFDDFGIPIQDMFNYTTNYDSFLTE